MPGLYDEFGKLEFVLRFEHEQKVFQNKKMKGRAVRV